MSERFAVRPSAPTAPRAQRLVFTPERLTVDVTGEHAHEHVAALWRRALFWTNPDPTRWWHGFDYLLDPAVTLKTIALDDDARSRRRVTVVNGRLQQAGKPLDTTAAQTPAGTAGAYMFVMAADGELYSADPAAEMSAVHEYQRRLGEAFLAALPKAREIKLALPIRSAPARRHSGPPRRCDFGLRPRTKDVVIGARVVPRDTSGPCLGMVDDAGADIDAVGFARVDDPRVGPGGAGICSACLAKRRFWPLIMKVDAPALAAITTWFEARKATRALAFSSIVGYAVEATVHRLRPDMETMVRNRIAADIQRTGVAPLQPEYDQRLAAGVQAEVAFVQRMYGTAYSALRSVLLDEARSADGATKAPPLEVKGTPPPRRAEEPLRELGLFHHSSFLGGAPVAGAGEWQTDKTGRLTFLNAKSGHYLPPLRLVAQTLVELQRRGVDVSQLQLQLMRNGRWETLPYGAALPELRQALHSPLPAPAPSPEHDFLAPVRSDLEKDDGVAAVPFALRHAVPRARLRCSKAGCPVDTIVHESPLGPLCFHHLRQSCGEQGVTPTRCSAQGCTKDFAVDVLEEHDGKLLCQRHLADAKRVPSA